MQEKSSDYTDPADMEPTETNDPAGTEDNAEVSGSEQNATPVQSEPERRYPIRVREPPPRYV